MLRLCFFFQSHLFSKMFGCKFRCTVQTPPFFRHHIKKEFACAVITIHNKHIKAINLLISDLINLFIYRKRPTNILDIPIKNFVTQ